MLGPKPVQLVGFRGGEIFRVPQSQPRGGARRERPLLRIGHRRQAAFPAGPPGGPLLSLAQALGIAGQRGIAAAVAAALDLAEQAATVAAAGVPALQNDRLPRVKPAPAGIAAAAALRERLVPQVADDGAAPDTEMATDGLAGPAVPVQPAGILPAAAPGARRLWPAEEPPDAMGQDGRLASGSLQRRLLDRAEVRDVCGENGFQHRGEVLNQMEADLLGLWRAPTGAFGIGPGAIPISTPGCSSSQVARVSASRSGNSVTRCRRSRSISTVPYLWPLRNAQSSTPRTVGVGQSGRGAARINRSSVLRDAEFPAEPGAGGTAKGHGDGGEALAETQRPARPRGDDARQALGEDPPPAVGIVTEQLAHAQFQPAQGRSARVRS